LGKGEATATSHLFTSLDREQKGEFSAQKREERGERKDLEKNKNPVEKPVAGQRKK